MAATQEIHEAIITWAVLVQIPGRNPQSESSQSKPDEGSQPHGPTAAC